VSEFGRFAKTTCKICIAKTTCKICFVPKLGKNALQLIIVQQFEEIIRNCLPEIIMIMVAF